MHPQLIDFSPSTIQGGGGPKHLFSSGLLSQYAMMSRRTIMTAILQTLGPVSTCKCVRCNWRCLRSTTVQQFLAAATELHKLGFGNIVALSGGNNRLQQVFIKSKPEETWQALESNPGLCGADVYKERFHKASSKKIGWDVRVKLIEMGLVAKDKFM